MAKPSVQATKETASLAAGYLNALMKAEMGGEPVNQTTLVERSSVGVWTVSRLQQGRAVKYEEHNLRLLARYFRLTSTNYFVDVLAGRTTEPPERLPDPEAPPWGSALIEEARRTNALLEALLEQGRKPK